MADTPIDSWSRLENLPHGAPQPAPPRSTRGARNWDPHERTQHVVENKD